MGEELVARKESNKGPYWQGRSSYHPNHRHVPFKSLKRENCRYMLNPGPHLEVEPISHPYKRSGWRNENWFSPDVVFVRKGSYGERKRKMWPMSTTTTTTTTKDFEIYVNALIHLLTVSHPPQPLSLRMNQQYSVFLTTLWNLNNP